MKKNGNKPGKFMRLLAIVCALILCIQAIPVSTSMNVMVNAAEKESGEESSEKSSEKSSEEKRSSSESSSEGKTEKSEEKKSEEKEEEKKEEKTDNDKNEEKSEDDKHKDDKEKDTGKSSDEKDGKDKESSSDSDKAQNSGSSKTGEDKNKEDVNQEDKDNNKEEKDDDKEKSSEQEGEKKPESSSGSDDDQNSGSGKTEEKAAEESGDKKEEKTDGQESGNKGSDADDSGSKESGSTDSGSTDSGKKEGTDSSSDKDDSSVSNKDGEDKKEDNTASGKTSTDGKEESGSGKTDSQDKKDNGTDTKTESGKDSSEKSEKDKKPVTDEKTEKPVKAKGGGSKSVAVTISEGDDEVNSDVKIKESQVELSANVSGAGEYSDLKYTWSVTKPDGSSADENAVKLENEKTSKVKISSVAGKQGGKLTLKVVVKSGDTTLGEKTANLDVYTEYGVAEVQIKDGKGNKITDGKADVSDTLSASLTFKSGASDDDKDEDQYSFRWQKKDSEGEFKDIEGSSASSKSYQVNEEGTYRVVVTRAADSDHNRLAYESKGSTVKASKIPVSIVWENKSRTYDGTAVFSYSGKGTVTRTDDSTIDPWEISPGTAQEITLSGSDAGDYEDVEIPSGLDTDIYAVSSSKANKLTINPYPINAEVTVWGKNFDNTTDVKAPTGDSTLSVKWSDLDTALSATEIKDSLQLLLDGNALAYTDLVYSGAGDVDSDTSVSVALKSENASKKFTVSGDTGEGAPKYSNYTVDTVTFADAEIKAVTYEAGTVATNSSGVARGGIVWVDENATIGLAAKEGYQIGNDYKNDSDFGDSITADVHKKNEDGTGFDGVVFYAKNANGEIGKVTWESIKVDKTAPTVTMVDVKKISNAEYTNKYTVSDTEAGIGSVKVLISETDQTDATPDDSWTTISLPDDKTAHDTNEFTFEITVPAYGYVYVYAKDQLDNKSVTESHVAIYEETPPAVTITCPDASNPTKGKTSIEIKAEDGDKESGVKSMALSLVDSKGQPVSDAFTVDDTALPDGVTYGNNQFTRSGSDPETLTQAQAYKTLEAQFSISEDKKLDGDYTLSVTALDYCGNSNTATAVLKFDNTAPTFEVSLDDAAGSAVEGTYYYNAASGEGLTVTLFDINLATTGGAYSALLRDAQNHVLEGSTMVIPAEGDQTRGTISFSASDIKNNLEDGQVTLEVTAADAANNVTGAGGLTKASPESIGKSDGSVSFVLDKTAPELVSSKTTIPEGNKNPNFENSTFYYSGTFTTVATITDLNIDNNYVAASFSEISDPTSGFGQISISDDGKELKFFGLNDAFFGYLKVEGKDYAGNPLKVSASFSAGTSDGQDAWEEESQDSGILRTANKREIESGIPVASVTYKELDKKRIVGKTAYYKDSITAELVLSEVDSEDYGSFYVSVKKDGESVQGYTDLNNWDNNGKISLTFANSGEKDHSADGNYNISIRGKNRADTPITVKEFKPDEKTSLGVVTTDGNNDYSMQYTLVLDTTNPIAKVEITPADETANKDRNEQYGNRYYFNKNHTAKVTVTDKNINISDAEEYKDKGTVKVLFAQEVPATKDTDGKDKNDGYTDASQVTFALDNFDTAVGGNSTELGAEFEYATLTEGVRQYLVEGEDLAGNLIVVDPDSESVIDSDFSDEKGIIASYPVVTDTVTPLMVLTVNATRTDLQADGTTTEVAVEAYRMNSNGDILTSDPYQRAEKATVLLQLAENDEERTPYRFNYHKKTGDGEDTDCSETAFSVTHTSSIEGNSPSMFWIDNFYVEDLAGNSTAGHRTHNIYLDTNMPVAVDEDIIAPTITLYPTIQTDAKYGVPGSPLFNKDVPFAVKVQDPYGPAEEGGKSRGSSGIGKVSYNLQYTKKDGNKEKLIKETYLYTFDKTTEHGGTTILDDSAFVYKFEDTIEIDSKTNNYNTLILTVTAIDNVGNETTVTYDFGIDITSPVITLSYNNNIVRNDCFFKEGRTATIKVKERNFDKSLIEVTVTGDANGSNAENAGVYQKAQEWGYLIGSAENGDDDIHSYTVDFQNDGDYTLNISAVDHAGNPAELVIEDGTKAWRAFVIDKTAPNVSISMGGSYQDGPDGEDGHYYYKADNCSITASFDDNGHEFGMEGGEYSVTIDGRTDNALKKLDLVKMEPASGAEKYRNAQNIVYTAQELAQGVDRLLVDGKHVITVKAVDAAGNEATAVLTADTGINTALVTASNGCEFEGLNGAFILDTECPQVTQIVTTSTQNVTTSTDISGQVYPISDNNIYTDTNSVYYNKDIQVKINIEDSYIRATQFMGSVKKNSGTASSDVNASLNDDPEHIGELVYATYSMQGDNAYSGLVVSGCDKAGNLLQLAENYSYKTEDGKTADELQQDDTQTAKGEVSAKHGKVVDKTNPTASVRYESDDYANIYSEVTKRDDNITYYESAYYNQPITVKMSFEDNYELDGKKLHSGKEKSESNSEDGATGHKKYSAADIVINKDSRSTYTVYGTDRALNPTLVSEMIPNTDEIHNNSFKAPVEAGAFDKELKTQAAFVPVYEMVLDMTNPVATVEIMPANDVTNKSLNTEYGNRYYFNANHVATVTVKEENLNVNRETKYKDKGIVRVIYAEQEPATKNSAGIEQNDGYKDASAVKFNLSSFVTNNEIAATETANGASFTYDTFAQGVRQYLIKGEDLAGNPVVYEESAKNIDTSFSGTADGVFASYPVVTDTIVPLMWLTVTAKKNGKESIAYKMDSTGAVLASDPYQKAADASIVAQLADVDPERTPYRFYFHEEDTNDEEDTNETKNNKINDKFALMTDDGKKQNLSMEVKSPLVFWVKDFYVEDLAGNRSSDGLSTANIYLDTQEPGLKIEDKEAPTIVLYPKERKGYKYGIDGRPLFNDDVPFVVEVVDPYGPDPKKNDGVSRGSTGLKKVKYSLKYKNDNKENVELTNEDNQDIFTYNEVPLNNSTFVYDFDDTITIKKRNNYNSLTLTVTATDNVGNTSKITYTFGIDITAPVVTLSYDNNDAKNEKYFKKGRKATIKVRERNFDADLFTVKVTGKANGSTAENAGIFAESAWSCKKGNFDNGDDDVWTKTVTFKNDGDYTLAVVANQYKYLKKDNEKDKYTDYAVIDRAGNPAKLTVVEETKAEYKFTIDTIAPTFTLDISSKNSTNKNLSEQGNRYYFNKEYTATVTVSDVNYDAPSITVLRGTFTSDGKYNSEKRVVSDFDERITSKTNIFKDKIGGEDNSDGVYRYVIFGCDKAGNALVPSSMENLDGTVVELGSQKISEIESKGSLEKTANKSVHIVVDKTAPKGSILIKEVTKEKTESIYETDVDGNVTFASPYRQGTEASIKFSVYVSNKQENESEEFEHSPVKIDYQVDSTVDGGKKDFIGKEYVYNNSKTRTQKGKQIFSVTKYTLTDLAGNKRSYGPFNNIHLDVVEPVVDELGPITKIVASAEKGTSGYMNDQNLFSSDVKLKIKVTDPEDGNSSGLGKITYQMYIGDKLVDGDTVTLHEDNTKKYDGNYKDNNKKYNSQIERECIKEISVSSKSHNYNNLRAVVTAFDNAGNSSTKEYRFGIDITAPTVEVSYDNNSAQNGEYFNKDRTATVVVKDRNFDRDKFKIKTESNASISGWTHKSNGGNGDSDTWTAKVTYSKDGNYTLEVSGTDRVNNKAVKINYNGTAPRKFTIDKTPPKITVTYDNNNAANSKYYKDPRTATISVDDVNFNGQNAIRVSASGGGNAPSVGFSGKIAKLTFDKDGIYNFSGTVTDMAGNTTAIPTQTEFVIDRTAPAVTVTYDNNDVQNGKYYKAARTATIAVSDVNFTGQNTIKVESSGGGVSPSVSFGGNTAKLPFTEDGIYNFNGTVTDMAGNVTTIPTQSEFVIDTKAPVLRFANNEPFAVSPAVDDKTSDHPKNNQFFTADTFAPKVTVKDTNCSTALTDAVFQIIGTRSSNSYVGEVGAFESGATQFDIFVSSSKFKVESETDDVYTLTTYAIDLAGNKSEEVSFTFSINRFGSNFVADEDSGTRAYLRDQYYHNDTDHDLLIREYNPNTIKKDSQSVELVVNGNTASRRKLVLGTDYEFKEDAESRIGGRIYLYTIKKSVFEQEGDYSFTISSEDEAGHKNSTARIYYDKDENGKPTGQEVHSFPIDFVVDKTAPTNQLAGVSSNSKQTFNQDSLTMEIYPEDAQTAVSEVEVRRWKTTADFFGNPSIPDRGADPEQITVYRYFENGVVPEDEGSTKYADLSEYTDVDTDKIVIDYSIKGGSDWQVVEVITTDLAGNKSTDIREGGISEAGVTLNETRRSYLVTTDLLTRLINNPAVRVGVIVVAGLIIALIIMKRRKKENA